MKNLRSDYYLKKKRRASQNYLVNKGVLVTPFQFIKNSLQLQCLYRRFITHENSNNIWNF